MLAEIPPCEIQKILYVSLLILAAVIDTKRHIIPDVLNAGIAFAAVWCFSWCHMWGLLAAFPFLAAAMKGKMGGGDVKFVAANGLVMGLSRTLWGSVLGMGLLLCFHGGNWLFRKHKPYGGAAYPMAPFLAAGFLLVYFIL